MFGLRTGELIIILLIVVVLFGANKLPQLGAGLGQSIRGFKKALNGDDDKPSTPSGGDGSSGSPKA
jgi:sec-independent protein translocase protein TatA